MRDPENSAPPSEKELTTTNEIVQSYLEEEEEEEEPWGTTTAKLEIKTLAEGFLDMTIVGRGRVSEQWLMNSAQAIQKASGC